jgi:hypothetical protein
LNTFFESNKVRNKIILEDQIKLGRGLQVNFPDTEESIEVVPQERADLPHMLTGLAAVWVESEGLETNTYHLRHSYDDKNFPAIEYINKDWFYLNWNKGKYYTKPLV